MDRLNEYPSLFLLLGTRRLWAFGKGVVSWEFHLLFCVPHVLQVHAQWIPLPLPETSGSI